MPVPDFSPGEVLTAAAMDSRGLWLVKSQTIGAGVSSVVITDAFSADFDAFKIIISGGVASLTRNLTFQLGPTSVSGYNTSYYYSINGRTFANTVDGLAGANATEFSYAGVATADDISYSLEVINPFLAKHTFVSSTRIFSSTTTGSATTGFCVHRQSTSYSDFSIGLLSGGATLTGGSIRVYGYRN